MALGYLLCDGEAESGPFDSPGCAVPVKELENLSGILFAYPCTIIGYVEDMKAIFVFMPDFDPAQPLSAVLECVVDIVAEDPQHAQFVGPRLDGCFGCLEGMDTDSFDNGRRGRQKCWKACRTALEILTHVDLCSPLFIRGNPCPCVSLVMLMVPRAKRTAARIA